MPQLDRIAAQAALPDTGAAAAREADLAVVRRHRMLAFVFNGATIASLLVAERRAGPGWVPATGLDPHRLSRPGAL